MNAKRFLTLFAGLVTAVALQAVEETTIAAWVKLDAMPTADKSVGVRKLWTSADSSRALELAYNSANGAPYLQLWARMRTEGKLFAVYQRDILDIRPGEWHHYCVTYSCKEQVMKLYVDGFFIGKRVKDYEGKSPLLPLPEGTVAAGNVPLEGLVTCDRTLGDAEVKALAAKGRPAQDVVKTDGFAWGVVDPTDKASWFLPNFTVPTNATRALFVAAAKDEYESASVVVRSGQSVKGLVPTGAPFVCGKDTLPASVVDIRVVKCVPTMATYPKESGSRILKPIMLMHDDDLLRVDIASRTAQLKLRTKDGEKYVPMSDYPGEAFIQKRVNEHKWLMQRYGTDEWPIYDAPAIQPLDLPAEFLKQYWITVKVPTDAKPGNYRSTLTFRDAAGKTLASVPFGLKVLPFALPEPKSKHDLSHPFRRLLYTRHTNLDFAPGAVGSITSNGRSEAQFRADMRNIREHGIESSTIMMNLMLPRWQWNAWGKHDDPTAGRVEARTNRVDTAYAKKVLKVLKEEGQLSHPHYINNGCNFGFREGYTAANRETLTKLVDETKAVFKEATGRDDLVVYAVDEAKGDAITRQYAVWEELRRQGVGVYATCLPKNVAVVATGKVDTVVQSVKPTKENAAIVHAYGGEILSYAFPQSGQKDEVHSYRLGYGFANWLNDYDGFSVYIWDEIGGHPWNEFETWGGKSYVYVFQTADGVVDTPSWEGQREAVDDVRYATLLRSMRDPEADDWLDSLDPFAPDFSPTATRREIIRRLLRLMNSASRRSAIDVATYEPGPEPKARLVTFADGAFSRGFAWQTDTSVDESELRLVPGRAQPSDFTAAPLVYTGTCTTVSLPTSHWHRVMAERLAPGRYSYRLGGAGRYAYGTLDVKAPGEKVTVVNFNDFQTSNPARLWKAELALSASVRAVGGADQVDFLLSGGDFVDGWLRRTASTKPRVLAGRSVEWGVACDTLASHYPSVPLVSSSGNHDFGDYADRMPIRYPQGLFPGCESLDYGNVHVATIPFAAGSWHERYEKIYGWLDRDLAAARARGKSDWTIVCLHWGPNTTGDHAVLVPATTNIVVRLGELCAKHRVDLVLQAHDHTFSKTLPYRWDGKGWTTAAHDAESVCLAPRQTVVDGESYDTDPQGTYYLSAGCLGHRVGENAAYACPTGSVSYTTRAYRIETGRLAVDSRWGKRGDPASSDLPRSMFGILRTEGRRLCYDWYVVDLDGSYELYDKLRIMK